VLFPFHFEVLVIIVSCARLVCPGSPVITPCSFVAKPGILLLQLLWLLRLYLVAGCVFSIVRVRTLAWRVSCNTRLVCVGVVISALNFRRGLRRPWPRCNSCFLHGAVL
jgi:hypothetical protein